MDEQEPIAFLSYVRADDDHDHGRITALRKRLEGEVRMHTGRSFKIFQDKTDLKWGQQWKDRLDSTLLNVTFIIPIVTPSYFVSSACRDEFDKFLLREKQLGDNRLILPVYYLDCDIINDINVKDVDPIAKVIVTRNWADWRSLRFKDINSPEVGLAISEMAANINFSMKEINSVIIASGGRRDDKIGVELNLIPDSISENKTENKSEIDSFNFQVPIFRPAFKYNPNLNFAVDNDYYIYTDEYDEEIDARNLSNDIELRRLFRQLKQNIANFERVSIDHIISMVGSIKSKGDAKFPVVTFLIDNSGSMRGTKIRDTASWAFIISKALESAGVQVEVLGFTTRAWKGGLSRIAWEADGEPSLPGRLNDLRHIIYKDISESSNESAKNFSLMIREGILKENVDGEALLWAYGRSLKRADKGSILIVLSDGAPVDDSTLSNNNPDLLHKHLVNSARWLESRPNFKIYGVGIEYDCKRYYKYGFLSASSALLGLDLINALPEWIAR